VRTPQQVSLLQLECTCSSISMSKWERLMKNTTRACHKTINRLVKEHLPDLYESLMLNLYNPYNYFKTKTHLILVHSNIEYFMRYEK
jgi:hypothetical protein